LIEYLDQFGRVVLANGKDDRFADFAADRITHGVFQKRLAQEMVGCVGEETLLKLALFERLLLVLTGVIGERDNEALFGKQRGGDFGAGIHYGWVDQEAFLNAVE